PESEIYSKSNELYGIYFAKSAIMKADKCFLVEGYTDVISMHQAGLENVVASSGTALTHGQIRKIRRFSENITVLYDGDTAGIKAAMRGIDLLLEEGMNVKVVLLPEGEDPDSFAKKQNADDFNRYIASHETDFIRFKTQLLLAEAGDDPIKRAGLITNIVESIALIPDAITRSVYIQDCSQLMELRENVLIAEVNKVRLRNYSRKKEQGASVPGAVRDEARAAIEIKAESFAKTTAKNPYDRFEYEILRYVVRYGELPVYRKYEKRKRKEGRHVLEEDVLVEEGPLVTEFVRYDLERDHIPFSNELYRRMFEEAVEGLEDEHFV
ncbi:MAG TPA: DNA primase, partial [Porphyromonadaceae bacterium]|nr:DNA primase [Porphyromonadaceae bacterium]